jgi:hypothetical protein
VFSVLLPSSCAQQLCSLRRLCGKYLMVEGLAVGHACVGYLKQSVRTVALLVSSSAHCLDHYRHSPLTQCCALLCCALLCCLAAFCLPLDITSQVVINSLFFLLHVGPTCAQVRGSLAFISHKSCLSLPLLHWSRYTQQKPGYRKACVESGSLVSSGYSHTPESPVSMCLC